MLRLSAIVVFAGLFLAGCQSEQQKKEKVHQAILDRLGNHSGLDLKALDVTTTAVSFEKNKAYATVAFHPKDDKSVNSGTVMKYTLEEHDGKWLVTGVGNSQGAGMSSHPPPAQPSAPGGNSPLPAGHPSLGPGQ